MKLPGNTNRLNFLAFVSFFQLIHFDGFIDVSLILKSLECLQQSALHE